MEVRRAAFGRVGGINAARRCRCTETLSARAGEGSSRECAETDFSAGSKSP
jgi:hypothetical protein